MKVVKIGLVLGLTAAATAATAMPAFMKVFQETYTPAKDSTITTAKCALCHMPKSVKLNPYGLDIKQALEDAKVKVVTPDILKKVEPLDSDKDGYTNIEEIQADTLPGDPASHPASHAAATK